MASEDDDYEVGYGRPPKQTRFQKGRSGNPQGRPKGSKNFQNLIEEALNETVTINEHGRRKVITKRHVIAKQLVNKAASGDLKALNSLAALFPSGFNTVYNPYDGQTDDGIRERIFCKLTNISREEFRKKVASGEIKGFNSQ